MLQRGQIEGMDLLAPKASPVFTGTPTGPTPSQAESDTTRLATVGFVRTAVAAGGSGGSGGTASLYVTDDGAGNIELTAVNTSSTLTVTDDNIGNIELTLT